MIWDLRQDSHISINKCTYQYSKFTYQSSPYLSKLPRCIKVAPVDGNLDYSILTELIRTFRYKSYNI